MSENTINAGARSDAEVIMDAPILTVTLAGERVEIREARIQDDLAFRRLADRLAGVVIGAVTAGAKSARMDEAALAAAIVPTIMGDGLPLALEMLWAYAPALDRERYEREATTDELEEAALAVLETAIPFIQGRLKKAMRMMRIVETMSQ